MKHLKQFETEVAYTQFKGTEDYVLPNVSYVKETKDVKFNPYVEPSNPNVVCIYNVTDISQEIKIFDYYNGSSCFSSMIVDGIGMDIHEYYQFDTVGNHTVEFVLNDPTIIGNQVFTDCYNLTSVTIPDSVTSIGEYAFAFCIGLTSVTIPDSVTSIGDAAFAGCYSLESFAGKFISEDSRCIIVDNKLIAFAPAGLTSYIIPDSVTSIGNAVFQLSSIANITIPDSVTSIEDFAIHACRGLTSVTIGNSVTSIGKMAFAMNPKLASITCYAPIAPTIQYSAFNNVSNGGTLYVPTGSDYNSWIGTSSNNMPLGNYNWTIQYI